MSGALRPSQRANVRESLSGEVEPSDGRSDNGAQYCVGLSPSREEIRAKFKSHVIMKVREKLSVANAILGHRETIGTKLFGQNDLPTMIFNVLFPDFRGERKRNDTLAVLLILLGTDILSPILDMQLVIDGFEYRIRTPLQNLKNSIENAWDIARSKRANTFCL